MHAEAGYNEKTLKTTLREYQKQPFWKKNREMSLLTAGVVRLVVVVRCTVGWQRVREGLILHQLHLGAGKQVHSSMSSTQRRGLTLVVARKDGY